MLKTGDQEVEGSNLAAATSLLSNGKKDDSGRLQKLNKGEVTGTKIGPTLAHREDGKTITTNI